MGQYNEIIIDLKMDFRCMGFAIMFHVEHELIDEERIFTGISMNFLFVQVKFGVLN